MSKVIDAAQLERLRNWSLEVFGPVHDRSVEAVLTHIRSELVEIEKDPDDLEEWIDLILLAVDGAHRSGHEPQDIINTLFYKQVKNEHRLWPDWRTVPKGTPVEHIRTEEASVELRRPLTIQEALERNREERGARWIGGDWPVSHS